MATIMAMDFAEITIATDRVVAPFLRGHHPATADALTYADGLTLAADAAAVAPRCPARVWT
jgi:hypothetical protein